MGSAEKGQLDEAEWRFLEENGYLRVPGCFSAAEFTAIVAAADRLEAEFPHGFIHAGEGFDPIAPKPRTAPPKPNDYAPTVIFPHIGFRDAAFHPIVEKPLIYNTIERALGPRFVLSNTWMQVVPAGLAARLAYHKDPHGSFSFTVLLDDQDRDTGSTCIVPGTHRSTPPPRWCINDPGVEHPQEVHISGRAGDVCFFSPGAWHGRAPNFGNRSTRRLFFACYGRQSHDAAMWSRAVPEAQLNEAMARLRPEHRHLLQVESTANRAERRTWSAFRRWYTADGLASMRPVRDFLFGLLGPESDGPGPGPYRTSLAGRFDPLRYLRHFKAWPTINAAGGGLLDRWRVTRQVKSGLKRLAGAIASH